MAGMGLAGGFGAGGGADALEELLKQAFVQQAERKRASQEDQRIKIAQQGADDNTALRKLQQSSLDEARAATQKLQAQTGAERTASMLPIGTHISGPTRQTLVGGDLGDLAPQGEGDTLDSRNLSGMLSMAKGAAPAPMALQGQLRSMPNAGSGTFMGTAQQHAAEQGRQDQQAQIEATRTDRAAAATQARTDRENAARQAQTDRQDNLRLTAALRPPPQQQTITVQTMDANGNAVTKIVPKTAGAEFAKPKAPNAALENRLTSARTVNKVGDSIIQKLSDPAFANVVGPAMGRAGTLGDLIGNPPPEFSELAGQIESYALANMGVHGMRSAQGAEQIKKLLDQHHTPQSLAATIRGLNDFSTRLIQDNETKPASGGKTGGFTVQEIKD